MPVQIVTKRIGQGNPDVLDVILNGHASTVSSTRLVRPTRRSWTASRSGGRRSSAASPASPRSTPRGRWSTAMSRGDFGVQRADRSPITAGSAADIRGIAPGTDTGLTA